MRQVEIVFNGMPAIKKNSKKISKRKRVYSDADGTKRSRTTRFISSSESYKSWEYREQQRILEMNITPFDGPVAMDYLFYPPDLHQFDLSNAIEGINDLLVKRLHIIPDDNLFDMVQIYPRFVCIDPERPRVELTITQFQNSHGWAIAILRDDAKVKAIAKQLNTTQKSLKEELMQVMHYPAFDCEREEFFRKINYFV